MRIYRMTATFGKLEHKTLELNPGLNIITAPNEWGKSTWCAFLVAMLYGIDTRAKTTKNALADKERYAPWSGSPMAGRIDLCWKGRDITIERKTKRRVPLGDFQAYETASGLAVPELTAANCGQMLLGVEQTVFRRAGFVRHADLPVTQDEALRRRLNALVTTGDDSGNADRLAESLKELKNRCRYNRTGLLPQAEAQRDNLENKLTELDTLDAQTARILSRLAELKQMLQALTNHQQALAYAKMEQDIARVAQAEQVLRTMEEELEQIEAVCAQLPQREETARMVRELQSFREMWNSIQLELRLAPSQPQEPLLPNPFTGLTAQEARDMVREDCKTYAALTKSKAPLLLILVGVFGLLAGVGLVVLMAYVFAAVSGIAGLAALIWGILEGRSMKKQTAALREKYGTDSIKRWSLPLDEYDAAMESYRYQQQEYQQITSDLEVRRMVLEKKRETLCGAQEPEAVQASWQAALANWENCLTLRRDVAMARSHYETLGSMVRTVEKPALPDDLTHTEEETGRLLTECAAEQQRLQNRLGQYQGRMTQLGDREDLRRQHSRIRQRITRLEETYAALVIAQETLTAARAELQRRFAPRITRKAQKLLSAMTDGRYHDLTMSADFSLQASAGEEDTLTDALWRSDGTMDQLYLALRLAVAQELTPQVPLILDDVLVRFDDQRMTAATELLREMAKEKQVILFTCQGREAKV